jgi:co-chaperonin GroES (HSP10)
MIAAFLTNKALIIPDADNTTSQGYALNTSYTPQHHFAVTGIVEKAPDKLVCDFERYQQLLKPKTQREEIERGDIANRGLNFMPHGIEIKEGDRVLFRYEGQINRDADAIVEAWLLMPYTDIFAVLDDKNNPTLINGNVFIEPDIELNSQYHELNSDSVGTIRFISEHPNKGYITDTNYTEQKVEVGQKVLFRNSFYRVISHPLHPSVNFEGTLFCIQRRDILGVIK